MRSSIVIAPVLLCGLALQADAAPGVNLRWNACTADGGAANHAFACDTNAGSLALVTSFELGSEFQSASGLIAVLDLASGSPVYPAW